MLYCEATRILSHTLFFSITCAKETQHLQLEPWPREKQIAVKWHIVALREAFGHDILQERFHVTHFAAVRFNNDTFHPDINVEWIYLLDTKRGQDQIVEEEQGWVLQGVLSRPSILRTAFSGQKFFTVLPLRVSNIYAKKKTSPRSLPRQFVPL